MVSKADKAETVRVYPVPGQFIVGVPAIVQDVSRERAKELLKWGGPHNPAFTTEPPAPPSTPPDEGADQLEPTGSSAAAGS